ncbi:hypothetical protein DM02DRAFT_52875 [Periconia macrospinosa]|uniref:Uncharacterized protein n=1 Tax=Periconia macrospinosa TaxID=97972 RepID=A0A2V1DM59_9PLEO|nr:hypothetical protein DM02DRAFT_52875 [Periconia macrospinosa]
MHAHSCQSRHIHEAHVHQCPMCAQIRAAAVAAAAAAAGTESHSNDAACESTDTPPYLECVVTYIPIVASQSAVSEQNRIPRHASSWGGQQQQEQAAMNDQCHAASSSPPK